MASRMAAIIPAHYLGCRDRFLGWSDQARRKNLHQLAYNPRFLILPWVEIPHLASHLLARMTRMLSGEWEVREITGVLKPAYQELIRQAAQGEVVHNDDTTMKILTMMPARSPTEECAEEKSERTGVFTSGIVSTREGRRSALFFTGRKHAGENLAAVLSQRVSELGPPIQMCDALSRNPPKEFQVILANCNAHGRRKFVGVAENFPEECRYVLEQLREVYKNDALAREQEMSPEQRLHFHQVESGPRMKDLEAWFKKQFAERKVEPNSGLGGAILYIQKYWDKLTLFLRQAGAPVT
jgi:transposase